MKIPFGPGARALRALRAALAPLPALQGLRVERLVGQRPGATMARGVLAGREVFIKHLSGPDAAEQTARQAAELRALAPRMSHGRYRVPELVAAFPEAGLAVTGFIEAQGLKGLLQSAPPAQRMEMIEEAGRWLALVAQGRCRAGQLQAGFWVARRKPGLAALAGTAQGPLAEALAARLEVMAQAVTGSPVTQARCHGDFAPHNLMRNAAALWGVDIHNAHYLPLAKDIARFLVATHAQAPGPGPRLMGLAQADGAALMQAGLLPPDEAARLMPFFIGVELADRLCIRRDDARRGRNVADAVAGFLAATAGG